MGVELRLAAKVSWNGSKSYVLHKNLMQAYGQDDKDQVILDRLEEDEDDLPGL